MKQNIQIAVLIACGLTWWNTAAAQVHEAWVRQYASPGSVSDIPTAMMVDTHGNVILSGTSANAENTNDHRELFTVKYSSDGTELWAARVFLGSGQAGGLALDSNGNAYVVAVSCSDSCEIVTVKYDAGGHEHWAARVSLTNAGNPQSPKLALDSSGRPVVIGADGEDAVAVKYSSAGQELWLRGITNFYPNAVAVDHFDNVVVAGLSDPDGLRRFTTLKLDGNGTEVWVDRTPNGSATAVTADAAGNAYVTGSQDGDYATVKYDPTGNRLWVARYSGRCDLEDTATAIAMDAAGDIYVTGNSAADPFGSSTKCCFTYHHQVTVKYDPNGNQLWASRLLKTPSLDGSCYCESAIAVDEGGNVCVTSSDGGYVPFRDVAYMTCKYDAQGNRLWVARYACCYGLNVPTALSINGSNNVYVTGWSANGTNIMPTTVNYVQSELAGFPAISTPPKSLSVAAGGSAVFSVAASGSGQLFYQWQTNAVEVPEATNAVFSLTNVPAGPAFDVSVVVSNTVGMTVSPEARLTVLNPPLTLSAPVLRPELGLLDFTLSGLQSGFNIEISQDLTYWYPAFFSQQVVTNENNVRITVAASLSGKAFFRAVSAYCTPPPQSGQ